MKITDIDKAKTKSSKSLKLPDSGEDLLTRKPGKPLAKGNKTAPRIPQRIGFMKGESIVPDDFSTMAAEEIADLFEGRAAPAAL
jgi:hypothetical protein